MQQGMLLSFILSLVFSVWSYAAVAMDINVVQQKQLLHDKQLIKKAEALIIDVKKDDLDALELALNNMPQPDQEVVRYLFLKDIEESEATLSANMEQFLEKQRFIPPVYHLIQTGDGYQLSLPAFNYPQIANQLTKSWRNTQRVNAFISRVERHKLILKEWLSGSQSQVTVRERLLLRELGKFSPKAITALVKQLTNQKVVAWLPSNRVMVGLVRVSRDPELYHLLWLMKVTPETEAELTRLSKLDDRFSISEIIQASRNPLLRKMALVALTQLNPIPNYVKSFLIKQLNVKGDTKYLAQSLLKEGHRSWLEQLIADNVIIHRDIVQQVLRQ